MKKLVKVLSFLFVVVTIVMYFVIDYHYETDRFIMRIMPNTDFEATLLRLIIYIIPGINLVVGAFGFAFSTSGILTFVGLLELLASYLTYYYSGKSKTMYTMSIVMLVMAIVFIIVELIAYRRKKNS